MMIKTTMIMMMIILMMMTMMKMAMMVTMITVLMMMILPLLLPAPETTPLSFLFSPQSSVVFLLISVLFELK